ncbi:hypothetical protein GDO78_020312 [Eleutherodactylus coqui]|uniref:Uncharacterized protein n=1 Tax=Eleutherodactylus coqui TaxID=57060 RepID=A0A8J6B506_ELECQ|nr:hypothetical protein GDO78_020312 [Eleutherodactylus coqui]
MQQPKRQTQFWDVLREAQSLDHVRSLSPLLFLSQTSSGILGPVLGTPLYNRHRQTGASSEKSYQDGERSANHVL